MSGRALGLLPNVLSLSVFAVHVGVLLKWVGRQRRNVPSLSEFLVDPSGLPPAATLTGCLPPLPRVHRKGARLGFPFTLIRVAIAHGDLRS